MTREEMMKAQKFGVEIEMTGITRGEAAQVIADHFGTTVSGPFGSVYYRRRIKDTQNRTWQVERDSSIVPQPSIDECRVEMVTPPLHYEDIETLQQIVRELRAKGAKVNSSCGIHVHVDGANQTPESLLHLVNIFIARQDLIYESLEIGERGNQWCKRLNEDILTALKSRKELTFEDVKRIWYSPANDGYMGGIDTEEHYNYTRYHGVNLHAFFSKGTVEFRLFNSTLHAGKIKAYIQFVLALSAWAITADRKVIFHSMREYTPEKKVALMRSVLVNRLGLSGKEFRTCRIHLLNPLKKAAGMPVRWTKHAA